MALYLLKKFSGRNSLVMRSMEILLKEQGHVRFYVTDGWKQDFYEELMSLGARIISGDNITLESISTFMGIDRNRTVGYISKLVWYKSFFSSSSTTIKVDYGKYRSGDDEYLITKPNITPVNWDDIEGIN